MEDWQQFKGREAELKVLETAWENSKAGDAQCVVLLADSGYGKTRVIHEFYRRISEDENQGRGGQGYWPDVLSSDPTKIDVNPDFTGFEPEGKITRRVRTQPLMVTCVSTETSPVSNALIECQVINRLHD